ncbi:MAG: hypothetical protein JST66_13350 [Bacteroidetes bacterium]|nr:hypothetical protein [Bacteroidota bacterium]
MNWSWKNDLVMLIGSLVLLFCALSYREAGDMGVVVLGVFLYCPYALILVLYNGVVMRLSMAYLKVLGAFIGVLPAIPLSIWLAISGGVITLRYWKLHVNEWTIMLTVLIALDLMNLFFIRERRASHSEEGK